MAEPWRSDFHTATGNKNGDAMRRALAKGLPVNGYVVGTSKEYTPLHYAVYEAGGANVAAVLIEAGADVNLPVVKSGVASSTPLGLAARRGNLAVVQMLLAAGAKVASIDQYDITPLSYSAFEKKPANEAVMTALLAAGAKPNYQALVCAARNGSPAMIEMLVAAGADVNEVSRWGTALAAAAAAKRDDSVAALLRAGADPAFRVPADHKTCAGETALDSAKKVKAKKVIALLEAAISGRPVAAAPAKAADDVPKLWKRIAKALKAVSPTVQKSLKKGASEAQLAAVEAALGVSLPAALRESYLIHNGQKAGADGLFPEEFAGLDSEFVLLSLDEMASQWRMWKELADAGEFATNRAVPDAGVRADWWNPKWVPVAGDGGGDSLCVDLAPASGGAVGQVILHQHAADARSKAAASFAALLQQLAEHLEEAAAG